MIFKAIGDPKRGIVHSPPATFEILGDREGTLAALYRGAERVPPTHDVDFEDGHAPDGYSRINTVHGVGIVASRFVSMSGDAA